MLIDANTQWVLAGSVAFGLSSGLLGALALLRGRGLLGDALAHAALPGICLVFIFLGIKQIWWFMLGAGVFGLLATMTISAVTRFSRIKEDTALALVLSTFFGFGIMLLTHIQTLPNGNQAGLDRFLFGQAAALIGSDVQVMTAVAAVLCAVTLLLFKEFKLLCFDPGFGRGLGWPMNFLDFLLMAMIVSAVVIGLQAVGVVLMAAMLITPAAAARYWTRRLGRMLALSGLFGAAAAAAGTMLSRVATGLPTGPLIVLAATGIFVLSILFAPGRGLVAATVRHLRLRRRIADENAGMALYELAETAGTAAAGFDMRELIGHTADRHLRFALKRLRRRGIAFAQPNGWHLTPAGLEWAYELVRARRLWEVFLMHESDFGDAAADRDAADPVAGLAPPVRQNLARLLKLHGLEPRLRPRRAGDEAT